MQFVLITLVILPVLPDKSYGPYDVVNPFKIWLFVILIVGISLCGYVIFKFAGGRAGTWIGGILGGVISSTATTFSYARRSRAAGSGASVVALVIMIASTVLYLRVLVLVATVAPGNFLKIAPPLAALFVACAVITGVAAALNRKARPLRISQPEKSGAIEIRRFSSALCIS